MDGVDINTPPGPETEKMFWPLNPQDNVDDIAMLASRRRAALNKPASASSVTINNDFAGLATLLQPFRPATSTDIPNTPRSRPAPILSASPAKPAQMTVAEFCNAFKLKPEVLDRLLPLDLDGPHVFEFLENSVLDSYLTIGQRTSLRYAEAQWKKGKIA